MLKVGFVGMVLRSELDIDHTFTRTMRWEADDHVTLPAA
jgi:hypothetical protein